MELRARGLPRGEVIASLDSLRAQDADWRGGKTWSLVYNAGDDVTQLLKDAYSTFIMENALSPMAFPSLRRLETEVLAMAASLFHCPEAVGSLTTGGTESILMALKTARDWGRTRGVTTPEVLLPITAHPAFEKAAHYLGIKTVHIPRGDDYRADMDAARLLVSERTVLVVGSAPAYPQGVVDPIEELAALALERGILCHVDACLGGFLLPFLEKLGEPIPPFDFRVPGVTSISADVHKYGYAAKGASCILYRDAELRKHQYYAYADWPGGLYASPTMTGTRAGGAIAAAWAVMNYLGEEGYLRLARRVLDTSKKLQRGVAAIPGLTILGKPDASVFSFESERLPIYAVGQAMEEKGWRLDYQQRPASLHLMVTPAHESVADGFLADLAAAVARASGSDVEPGQAPGGAAHGGAAAVYGMLATLDDRAQAADFMVTLLDSLYTPERGGAP